MQPLITVIMYQIFPPNQRGLALGLSMVGWSFGPAIGPILGGYLIEAFNWRAGFYVSVPLGLAGFVAALVYLPSLPRPARKTMDQVGLLTMAVALVTLLMALAQGRREGWDSTYIVTLFIIAAVTTVLFLVYEWQSASPLVDLRLFRSVPFALGCLVVFISTCAFRGTGVITIVFMQQVLEFTPLDVGWLLLVGNIAYGIAVVVAGRMADTMNPNVLVVAGLGIFVVAFFSFAGVNETVTVGTLIFLLALRLTSFGVVGSPNNLSAMQALSDEHVVMASGIFSLVRSISGTIGTAVSATFYEQRYFYHLERYAEDNDLTSMGLQEAQASVQHFLQWAGAARLPPAANGHGAPATAARRGHHCRLSGLLSCCSVRRPLSAASGTTLGRNFPGHTHPVHGCHHDIALCPHAASRRRGRCAGHRSIVNAPAGLTPEAAVDEGGDRSDAHA